MTTNITASGKAGARTVFNWPALVRHLADKCAAGELTFHFPDGTSHTAKGAEEGPHADISLHNAKPLRQLLLGGDLGFATAYLDGDWDTSDLTRFFMWVLANETALEDEFSTRSRMRRLLRNAQHLILRRNTRRGSRRNISKHYDLGNAFYSTWLDASMTYSSAVFDDRAQSLVAGQDAKYRKLGDALGLEAGHHVLEIGCGWGGFAEFAAREYGCRITCITISTEQAAWARERIAKAGLADKVEIRLQDYRDVTGTFDRIASIEMFEAVGEAYWDTLFATMKARLKPGGRAGLQIITIEDARFEDYRSRVDFIQWYVFPGGMLPTPAILRDLGRRNGFALAGEFTFGADYAETLRRWHDEFEARWTAIRPLGYDEWFRRMWKYYLCYCEAGFDYGAIDVGQYIYAAE